MLKFHRMIRTLADAATQDIWNGVNSKDARRISPQLWGVVRRKLDQLDAVAKLDDRAIPPGNRPHPLAGKWAVYHAIRVNEQYRLVFRFDAPDAWDVLCTDYR